MWTLRTDILSVLSLVGSLLRWFSLTLLVPIATALIYGEDPTSFVITLVLVFLTGFLFEQTKSNSELGTREGFLVVSLSWLAVALFGALP